MLKITPNELYRDVLVGFVSVANLVEHEGRRPLALRRMHGWRLQSGRFEWTVLIGLIGINGPGFIATRVHSCSSGHKLP